MSDPGTTEFDLAKLRAEIDDEVARRRESGELPAELERDLDLLFAQYAPPAAVGDDMEALLAQVERASFIDVSPPVDSVRPGVPAVKKVLRRSMGWYFRHVAQQVGVLADAARRALVVLDERVSTLERSVPETNPELADALTGVDPFADAASSAPPIVAAMAGVERRVLHGACGDGWLLGPLTEAGIDAFGCDRRLTSEAAGDADVDLRAASLADVCASVADGVLGGVVITGAETSVTSSAAVALCAQLGRVVDESGRIVIASPTPQAWAAHASPVLIDLSPGRPLHAETWAHLLAGEGFTSTVTGDHDHYVLIARRG